VKQAAKLETLPNDIREEEGEEEEKEMKI